jgi:hypothetical protein
MTYGHRQVRPLLVRFDRRIRNRMLPLLSHILESDIMTVRAICVDSGGDLTPPKSLEAMLRTFLNELTETPHPEMGIEDLRYAIVAYLKDLAEPVCLMAMLSDDNPNVSVEFIKETYWIIDKVGTPTVIPFVETGGVVERALKSWNLAWFKDPLTADVGVPEPQDYRAAFERSLRQDASGYEITEDALALCVAFASQNSGDRFFVRDLVLAAVSQISTDPTATQSTIIHRSHVEAAAKKIKFGCLDILKSPPENILFAQAYAKIIRGKTGANQPGPRYSVPVSELYKDFAAIERPLIGTATPAIEFEELKSSLVRRGLFALDHRSDTITIKKEWAYLDHLDQILTMDYYTEVAAQQQRRPTTDIPTEQVKAPPPEDAAKPLYLGHLAALIAIFDAGKTHSEPMISVSDVYPGYVEMCKHIGVAAAGRRRGFYNVLSALEAKGMICRGGRGTTVCVDASPTHQRAWMSQWQSLLRKLQDSSKQPTPPPVGGQPPDISGITPTQQQVLDAILTVAQEKGKRQVLLSEAYQKYGDLCGKQGKTPFTKQRFKVILGHFESRGLIKRDRCYIGGRPNSLIQLVNARLRND